MIQISYYNHLLFELLKDPKERQELYLFKLSQLLVNLLYYFHLSPHFHFIFYL